ncbi:unnamed protein product [Natator depressus]
MLHYVVVSPAVLYHPHTGTVSVHLSDLNETIRVSVRLERGDGPSAIPLLEREVQEPRLHENVRFQVPAPSGGQQEVAELHVSIRGDALHFSERKKVLLQALEPGTLVQTDKAIYKPGQTGERAGAAGGRVLGSGELSGELPWEPEWGKGRGGGRVTGSCRGSGEGWRFGGAVCGEGDREHTHRDLALMEMVPTACSLGFIQAGDGASLGSLFPPQAVPSGQG